MLERGREYPFEAVVEELKRMYVEQGDQAWYDDEGWCVYVRESDIEEILPQFIRERDCELAYMDEMLQDVVAAALHRKKDITNEELMEAIDYYDYHDAFMEV